MKWLILFLMLVAPSPVVAGPVVQQDGATATAGAERIYAPEELTGCYEMIWYRMSVGLPDIFDKIGYRESRCINDDEVRTSCCHGYWQMSTTLHLRDHRLAPQMAACGVTSFEDLNSNTPEDKRRQACAAKALYDLDGTYPWVATR